MIWKSVLLVLRKQECLWLLKTKCNYDHIQQGPFGTNYLLNIKGLEFDSQKEMMCLKKFFCLGAFQSLETVGETAKFLSINWRESVDEECHLSLRSMTRTSAASPIFCALNRNRGSCHLTGEQPLTSSWLLFAELPIGEEQGMELAPLLTDGWGCTGQQAGETRGQEHECSRWRTWPKQEQQIIS